MAQPLLKLVPSPSTHDGATHRNGVFKSDLLSGTQLERELIGQPKLCLTELAGRLSEFSAKGASALLSFAFELVLDAQNQGEPVGWLSVGPDAFFVPDAIRAGVDPEALAVVQTSSALEAAKAATRLAQSGGFGLLVLDLSRGRSHLAAKLLSRLVGLAQKHEMAIVFLTQKNDTSASLDSLISLRGTTSRLESIGNGRFRCGLEILKDKRRGPYWNHKTTFLGPAGIW